MPVRNKTGQPLQKRSHRFQTVGATAVGLAMGAIAGFRYRVCGIIGKIFAIPGVGIFTGRVIATLFFVHSEYISQMCIYCNIGHTPSEGVGISQIICRVSANVTRGPEDVYCYV